MDSSWQTHFPIPANDFNTVLWFELLGPLSMKFSHKNAYNKFVLSQYRGSLVDSLDTSSPTV